MTIIISSVYFDDRKSLLDLYPFLEEYNIKECSEEVIRECRELCCGNYYYEIEIDDLSDVEELIMKAMEINHQCFGMLVEYNKNIQRFVYTFYDGYIE